MAKRNDKTLGLVQMAIMIALIFVLVFFVNITIGPLNITLAMIPVCIGAILFGAKKGALLGFCFGLAQFLKNTMMPGVVSFVFTPFYSVGDIHGNGWSLVISFLPRILVGVVPYFVFIGLFNLLKKTKTAKTVALCVAGASAAITNTTLVLSGIYIFFGDAYASALGDAFNVLISGTILTNAIPEMIVCALAIPAVCNVLFKTTKSTSTIRKY